MTDQTTMANQLLSKLQSLMFTPKEVPSSIPVPTEGGEPSLFAFVPSAKSPSQAAKPPQNSMEDLQGYPIPSKVLKVPPQNSMAALQEGFIEPTPEEKSNLPNPHLVEVACFDSICLPQGLGCILLNPIVWGIIAIAVLCIVLSIYNIQASTLPYMTSGTAMWLWGSFVIALLFLPTLITAYGYRDNPHEKCVLFGFVVIIIIILIQSYCIRYDWKRAAILLTMLVMLLMIWMTWLAFYVANPLKGIIVACYGLFFLWYCVIAYGLVVGLE